MENRVKGPAVTYWCTICLKDLEWEEIWLSDNMDDNRLFCLEHAPDDTIRAKDTMRPR